MRINPFIYGLVVLLVFFGIILGFQYAGIWSTSGKVDASGEAIAPSSDDVNTIKGWMTLEQIATTYTVPLTDLFKQFNLPGDTPATTAIKDLESETFDTTALRTWLESRAQPVESLQTNEGSQAPTDVSTSTPPAAPISTPSSTEHVAPAMTITGKTTFQELLDWGVPKETIQKVISGDMPVTSTIIKDYISAKGMEFTSVKTQLQAEVDQIK
jgi:hypothetical protein